MKPQESNKKKGNLKSLENAVLNESQIAKNLTIVLSENLHNNYESINKLLLGQYLLNKILGKRVKKGMKFVAIYLGKQQTFQIGQVTSNSQEKNQKQQSNHNKGQTQPEKLYVVKETTKLQLEINKKIMQKQDSQQKIVQNSIKTTFLSNQLQTAKMAIVSSIKDRQQYLQNGLGPLKGIIISGFSGTGKSTLVKNILSFVSQQFQSKSQKIHCKNISSISLLSKVVGGAEEYIRQTFTELKQKQSSILVIEDLHLLFSQKQVSSNRTAMAALISQLQRIEGQKMVVIGTVNSDYELSPQLKGSGRFEKQIVLNLPNHHERLAILQQLIQGLVKKQDKFIELEDLKGINLRMNGFSIGEIKQIIRQAFTASNGKITRQSIEQILKNYKPSEIKELIVQVPEVFWNDIGGYQHVKSEVKKVAELPLKHPEVFKRFGIQPIKGIMLYGPPGCSKTMMAKAIATETKLNFIGVKGPQLFSKYVGDSQKAVRNIFKRARACSPCIIFFDEIDAIAAQRSSNAQVSDRVLCQLLNEMDGIEGLKQVIIIAATNKPQILDPALTRPGRFDYMIYVSPPDLEARKQIFRIYLKKNANHDKIEEIAQKLALKTDGYTGAQISLVCRESALIALQENINCTNVQMSHYELALKKVKRRLSIETIAKYRNFEQNLKY